MKVFRKRKKLNNEGMALVMVIVVIALVAIFASVLMSLALLNFKMKMTEREAKKHFYSAEEVLDEVHIGLEKVVSDAINEAYSKAMQNYKVDTFTEKYRVAQFKLDYMTAVQDDIKDNTAMQERYDVDKLVDMLDAELKAKYNPDNGPLIIRCTLNEDAKNLEATTRGLILKNISIEYTDGDYYSCIETDICIGYPEVELNEATVIPNVFDYSIIAHEKLTFDACTETATGNVYAGEEGVELVNGAQVEVDNVNYFVTRGETVVNGTTGLTVQGDGFWTKGIKVQNSGALSTDGDVYVQDDLTISGKNGYVTLVGNYYGYGDGKETAEGIAAGNSAIVLNCKNATLDMNGLDTLMLCGNAYINGDSIKVDNADLSEAATYNADQIMMGTSVAMKTDQIAFLAPAECLGTVMENGQTKVLAGRNPMSEEEYDAWFNTYTSLIGYKKLDENVSLSALKAPLSSYGLTSASFRTIFKRVGSETICYVYLKFDSAEQADRYYRDYMAACEERMEKYLKKYNNNVLFDRATSRQLTSGNILTYSRSNGYIEPIKGTITDSMDSDDKKALDQQKSIMVKNYAALCSKLSTNYNGLTEAELRKDVYENLILQSAVENIGVTKYELNGTTALIGDNNDEGNEAVKVGSESVNGDCKLVIVTGDVEVSGSFEGLIIAGGEVKVSAGTGVTLTADSTAVTKLLQHRPEGLNGLTLMEAYFIDGAKYVMKGNSLNDSAYVNLDKVITYINWTKK